MADSFDGARVQDVANAERRGTIISTDCPPFDFDVRWDDGSRTCVRADIVTAEVGSSRVGELEKALRDRRQCFEGALTDVDSILTACANLEAGKATPDGFASFVKLTAEGRKPLLELAIRQVDEALGGTGG